MYYDFFGLNQPPFRITPDTNLFFPGGNRGAVLEALIYAIQNGEGIVKVVGEVGSGKTMLCRMLEQELPANIEIVYLANPRLPPENVLHAIAFELKLPVQTSAPRLHVLNVLQEHLLKRHSENRQVVVFVEEAQGMPIATLEEIRLLSNLETRQSKLLQIVLFGQPELDHRIARPEIRQLKERITYSFHLDPFGSADIREYLNARLRACGYRRGELFTPGAVRAIGWHSRGLVRRINILADKSLLAAYADNAPTVAVRHVRLASQDSEFTGSRRQLWFGAGAIVAGVALLTLVLWSWQQRAVTVPASPSAAASGEAAVPGAGAIPAAAEPVPAAADPQTRSEPSQPGSITLQSDAGAAASPQPESVAPPNAPGTEIPADINNVSEVPPAVAGNGAAPLLSGPYVELPEGSRRRLTDAESRTLRRQLAALPPEDLEPGRPSAPEDSCALCWSLVYRPLYQTENL
jgi:type II secretory pathway predicted ATPase ExeA